MLDGADRAWDKKESKQGSRRGAGSHFHSCCGEMTSVGAAALGSVCGWLTAGMLRPAMSARSVTAGAAASGAVAAEALLFGGTAGALAAVAGIVGGAAAHQIWVRALRARVESTQDERVL
jgi:hypothetical protein